MVNNLKQFGLAVRFGTGQHDSNPPNVLSMSNGVSYSEDMVCPAERIGPGCSELVVVHDGELFLRIPCPR